jgi:hypothetical protein
LTRSNIREANCLVTARVRRAVFAQRFGFGIEIEEAPDHLTELGGEVAGLERRSAIHTDNVLSGIAGQRWDCSASSVLRSGTSALTVTESEVAPTHIVTSTRMFDATATRIPVCTDFLNPGASTPKLYGPAGRAGIV